MDWVIQFVGEVVFWGVGATVVLILSLGLVRAAPVGAEIANQAPHTGRFFYKHNDRRYVSVFVTQTVGALTLIATSLILWGPW